MVICKHPISKQSHIHGCQGPGLPAYTFRGTQLNPSQEVGQRRGGTGRTKPSSKGCRVKATQDGVRVRVPSGSPPLGGVLRDARSPAAHTTVPTDVSWLQRGAQKCAPPSPASGAFGTETGGPQPPAAHLDTALLFVALECETWREPVKRRGPLLEALLLFHWFHPTCPARWDTPSSSPGGRVGCSSVTFSCDRQ